MTRVRRWWAGHTLRFRVTLVVGAVALVVLMALSRLGAGLLFDTLIGAADAELEGKAGDVAACVMSGAAPADVQVAGIRIVDTAGDPVDAGPALPLGVRQMRRLAAGEAITVGGYADLRRWLAVPVVTPDGSTRLVVATADLAGGSTLLGRAAGGFLLAALLAAVVLALAAWVATQIGRAHV